MGRKHAILSASSAHRWLNCTPSAQLEEPVADEGSVFAAEGTLAHKLADLKLQQQFGLLGAKDFKQKLTVIQANDLYAPEMLDYVERFTEWVVEQFNEAKGRSKDAIIFQEQRVDFSRWVPEGFGTSDVTIIADGIMEVVDFKYGKGVEVSAEGNPQMQLYALGALDLYHYIYDIDRVRMTIHQPRIDNVSSYQLSVEDLLAWAEQELVPKAQMAWEGEGELAPGDWCKFCRVKERCRARAEMATAVANAFNYKHPKLLEITEVAELLASADAIAAWASDIKSFALTQARDFGVRFDGWKLVEGRSNRKYTDEGAIEKKLRALKYKVKDIFKPQELLGITAMEKFLGKSKFNEILGGLIVKPPGAPTLVAAADKRPEINSAATDFDL